MTGAERIAAERTRQIKEEGFGAAHDAQHEGGELAMAAVCYAAPEHIYIHEEDRDGFHRFVDPWPDWWEMGWDRRDEHNRIHQLEIAGALIAAEIDRLQALGSRPDMKGGQNVK